MAETQAIIETPFGSITLKFFPDVAPGHVKNFIELAKKVSYDGTTFHRVIPGFMIQGGGFDQEMVRKDGRAPIKDEADNGLSNQRGTLAMARTSDVDSATSQFFINLKDNDFLDHGARDFGYAVFGRVVDGMDVVDRIAAASDPDPSSPTLGKPLNPQKLLSIELSEEPPPPPPPVFFGLDRRTFDAAHIVRSVMAGTILNLGYGVARMKGLGLRPAEIRATGGGAKSRVWLQIVADVFGTPVSTLREPEAAAYGAALQAVWNWRLAGGKRAEIADIAGRWVAKGRSAAEPDQGSVMVYAERQARFDDLWKRLAPDFEARRKSQSA